MVYYRYSINKRCRFGPVPSLIFIPEPWIVIKRQNRMGIEENEKIYCHLSSNNSVLWTMSGAAASQSAEPPLWPKQYTWPERLVNMFSEFLVVTFCDRFNVWPPHDSEPLFRESWNTMSRMPQLRFAPNATANQATADTCMLTPAQGRALRFPKSRFPWAPNRALSLMCGSDSCFRAASEGSNGNLDEAGQMLSIHVAEQD